MYTKKYFSFVMYKKNVYIESFLIKLCILKKYLFIMYKNFLRKENVFILKKEFIYKVCFNQISRIELCILGKNVFIVLMFKLF